VCPGNLPKILCIFCKFSFNMEQNAVGWSIFPITINYNASKNNVDDWAVFIRSLVSKICQCEGKCHLGHR
jgi:hypothetical protein